MTFDQLGACVLCTCLGGSDGVAVEVHDSRNAAPAPPPRQHVQQRGLAGTWAQPLGCAVPPSMEEST